MIFNHFFKSLFKNYNEWLVWTTKLFSCICDNTQLILPTGIRMVGWGGGPCSRQQHLLLADNSSADIDGLIMRTRPDQSQLPVCVCISGWLVAPATNTVKVMSNEVGLRLLCCGMCFTYMHTFICGDPPQYQNFTKRHFE